jgi:23S rRNA G2069 N7-methylase RlmK/C1962 C5-methylase RlmI
MPPKPATARLPVIKLKVEKRNFHPWIFRKMLERPEPEGARDGDAVRIYDRRNVFIGRGLYNGNSQIGVRVLDWTSTTATRRSASASSTGRARTSRSTTASGATESRRPCASAAMCCASRR